jgi:hypothetical protein
MHTQCYTLSEHLVVDEVVVLHKGRIILKNYILKEHMFHNKTINYVTYLATHRYGRLLREGQDMRPQL